MTNSPDHRSELLAYATEVAKADDVDTVFSAMADAASVAFDFSSAVVETKDDGVLSVRSWSGRPPTVDGIPVDVGVAGRTLETGECQVVDDVLEDPRVSEIPDEAPRSVVSVPIGDMGVFQAGADEPGAFDEDDVELAELLASHCYQAVERIGSQRDVAESEARFRKLFEQADDALVLYDVVATGDSDVQLVNDAAESLFDTSEADVRGQSMSEYFDADPEQFHPGDESRSFTTNLLDDPAGRVFEVRVKPFLRENGPDAFAIVSDVTEQHHREDTLTGLHDATRRMLVADDPDAIAEVIVDAADDLLGLPFVGVFFAAASTENGSPRVLPENPDEADELRPAAMSEQVGEQHPVFRPGESLAWDVYASGTPESFENVIEEPNVHNPETRIREEIIHPLGDHGVLMVGATETDRFDPIDHDLVRVLATNAEAALDRAEHVRQLRASESELRRERNRLAALFENVPSPTASFVVRDGVPIVRSINPAFERVFGYEEAELVGEDIDEHIVPPKRESEADVYNRKLVEGQNINVEVRRSSADGPRDFLLDVVPFRLDEPNVHGYAMYTDITERKERERELERQNDRLEEFASIVSHDLRNPLNVARGYLELAEQTSDDQYFDRTNQALDRMHDIIESVLELARHGRSLNGTEAVRLADAANRAWRNVDTDAATLSVADDVTLDADPSRFGSLLENLFRNAVEHGPEGSVSRAHRDAIEPSSFDVDSVPDINPSEAKPGTRSSDAAENSVTVTVGTLDGASADGEATGESVTGFYVEDDGVGIPPDERDVVFEYGETRNEDGTGFGLAIVKSVAEAHGWTPSISESDAGGARFEFRTA